MRMTIAQELAYGRPSRMRRPCAQLIRGCSRPTKRWPRSRSRSGPRKTSRSVWPRSARTARALPNSRGADRRGTPQRPAFDRDVTMSIISLFDKSFVQSLTVDESVWLDRFFYPVVCPIFYVETLADLSKKPRGDRTADTEVRIIADKFPEMSGTPCGEHLSMAVLDILG